MSKLFGCDQLALLLGRSENDPLVRSFFGDEMGNIARDEYYGSLEFKPEGVGVVFQEAAWVVPSAKVSNPKLLYVAAFHLYREGLEGFAGYKGRLPNGVALADSEYELLSKMGEPMRRGGGGWSPLMKQPVPYWFWFAVGEAILHFQLDSNGLIDMATLQTPKIESK